MEAHYLKKMTNKVKYDKLCIKYNIFVVAIFCMLTVLWLHEICLKSNILLKYKFRMYVLIWMQEQAPTGLFTDI